MLMLFIVLPLVFAAVMPLLERLSRRLPDLVAALVMAGLLGLALKFLPAVAGGQVFRWSAAAYGLHSSVGVMMDGLSLLFLVTIALVAFFSCVFSVRYMDLYSKKGSYYSLLLIVVAGMNGVVLTTDLFSLYVFLEVAAVAGYALVAFGQDHDGVEAAFKYLMLSAVATTGILLALSFIYFMTGSVSFAGLSQSIDTGMGKRLIALCLAFFLMGFGLKAAMVPFHGWTPDVYPSAPAPISALMSGILGKVSGIYALVRILYGVFGFHPSIQQALMTLGVLSMLVGALLALGQTDMKRMLAYSSISQIGYIVIGLATWTPLGIAGGLFHLFNHGLFKALLFLDAGSTEYATGTRDLRKLGGINNRLPITGLTTTIGFLSTAGVPPFNGFWSKLMIVVALVQAGRFGIAALAIGASILTLWYFLNMQREAFYGKLAVGLEKVKEVPFAMGLATFCLAALCLAIGLMFPWIVKYLIEPGAVSLVGSGISLF